MDVRSPRKAAAAALSTFLLLAAAPAAHGASSIIEFGGLKDKNPSGIAAGPDGRLWFTEAGDPGYVGRMDVDGSNVVEYEGGTAPGLTANRRPYDIAAGGDGNLWVAAEAGAIVKVTPGGAITEYTAGLPGTAKPHGIAWGPDGHVWFTDSANPAGVGELDPATGSIEVHALPDPASAPEDIVAGADGRLWFTEGGPTPRIGRMDTDGALTELTTGITPGRPLAGIALGPLGNIWFTERVSPGYVGRVTPDGAIQEFALDGSVKNPRGIVAGTDDGIWVVGEANPAAITRLGVDGVPTVTKPTSNQSPRFLAVGPDNNVWFTQNGSGGGLARVSMPPKVTGVAVADVGARSARLHVTVKPSGQPTTWLASHGPTADYGTDTAAVDAGSGTAAVTGWVALEGLQPETTYHLRVAATNTTGSRTTDDVTFTTAADPPPPPAEDPLLSAVPGIELDSPRPATGDAVVLDPVGKVRIKGADGRWYLLANDAGIPVGATLDTTSGLVRLTSSLPGGGVQRGSFWGGVFKVTQDARTGVVELALQHKPVGCATGKRARTAARRRPPRLWGADNGGRFRTRGRGSVATVRGTQWLTEERCDGTLTRVSQGAVAVWDRRTKRTTLVKAGHSYLARTRKKG